MLNLGRGQLLSRRVAHMAIRGMAVGSSVTMTAVAVAAAVNVHIHCRGSQRHDWSLEKNQIEIESY